MLRTQQLVQQLVSPRRVKYSRAIQLKLQVLVQRNHHRILGRLQRQHQLPHIQQSQMRLLIHHRTLVRQHRFRLRPRPAGFLIQLMIVLRLQCKLLIQVLVAMKQLIALVQAQILIIAQVYLQLTHLQLFLALI